MERINLEVCTIHSTRHGLNFTVSGPEQRKAALRKVELELDEADDIVHSPSLMEISTPYLFFSRYLNLKLRSRSFRSLLNLPILLV